MRRGIPLLKMRIYFCKTNQLEKTIFPSLNIHDTNAFHSKAFTLTIQYLYLSCTTDPLTSIHQKIDKAQFELDVKQGLHCTNTNKN